MKATWWRMHRALQTVAEAVERRPALMLGLFSVAYLACAVWLALVKPLWHDEFFTLYIARAPGVGDILAAVRTGADQHPPIFYLISRAFFPWLGVNQLAVRLPEILAFWVMSLCLFATVARRSGAAYGAVALLLPLVTAAYAYATEARGYALATASIGVALLAWQTAADGRQRLSGLAGLTLASMLAVASHYYAVFALMALAIGELARTVSRRRVDGPIWLALAAGIAPLAVFAPFIAAAAGWSGDFWARAGWSDILDSYRFLLEPAATVGVIGLLGYVLWTTLCPPSRPFDVPAVPGPPKWELAAACGLTALPILTIIVAIFTTGVFAPRYALPAVVGMVVLIATSAHRRSKASSALAGGLIVLLGVGFVIGQRGALRTASATRAYLASTSGWLRAEATEPLPIVAWHGDAFLRLGYYAPAEVASRLVYLSDDAAALRHLRQNTGDRGLRTLQPWLGVEVESYRDFIRDHRRFYAYGTAGDYARSGRPWNWLLPQLVEEGAEARLVSVAGDDMLFLVTLGGHATR